MEIKIEQVALSKHLFQNYYPNWFSAFTGNENQFYQLVDQCIHLATPYYRDGMFKFPIPATVEGQPRFRTSVYKFNKTTQLRCIDELVGDNYCLTPYSLADQVQVAQFVEVILTRADILQERGTHTSMKAWEITAFHATLEKDPPPRSIEITQNLASKYREKFTYTFDDLVRSMDFWSRHCIIRSM